MGHGRGVLTFSSSGAMALASNNPTQNGKNLPHLTILSTTTGISVMCSSSGPAISRGFTPCRPLSVSENA